VARLGSVISLSLAGLSDVTLGISRHDVIRFDVISRHDVIRFDVISRHDVIRHVAHAQNCQILLYRSCVSRCVVCKV